MDLTIILLLYTVHGRNDLFCFLYFLDCVMIQTVKTTWNDFLYNTTSHFVFGFLFLLKQGLI